MGARFQQHAAVEAAPLEDEVILFHPDVNQFCVLNRASSVIWARLEQPATAEEVAAEVCARFEVTEPVALRDVERALGQMVDFGVIARV